MCIRKILQAYCLDHVSWGNIIGIRNDLNMALEHNSWTFITLGIFEYIEKIKIKYMKQLDKEDQKVLNS